MPEGTTLEKAREILHEHRIEKLLVVDKQFNLKGLITIKDIEKRIQYPHACKDEHGRLRVAAAVGVGPDVDERVELLVKAGVDMVVVDTAHGHARSVLDTVKADQALASHTRIGGRQHRHGGSGKGSRESRCRCGEGRRRAGIDLHHARYLGAGMPQLTAIMDCAKALKGTGIPIIADGGVKFSGDITKALAAGASAVMIGGLLAGRKNRREKPCSIKRGPIRCIEEWDRSAQWKKAEGIATFNPGGPCPS